MSPPFDIGTYPALARRDRLVAAINEQRIPDGSGLAGALTSTTGQMLANGGGSHLGTSSVNSSILMTVPNKLVKIFDARVPEGPIRDIAVIMGTAVCAGVAVELCQRASRSIWGTASAISKKVFELPYYAYSEGSRAYSMYKHGEKGTPISKTYYCAQLTPQGHHSDFYPAMHWYLSRFIDTRTEGELVVSWEQPMDIYSTEADDENNVSMPGMPQQMMMGGSGGGLPPAKKRAKELTSEEKAEKISIDKQLSLDQWKEFEWREHKIYFTQRRQNLKYTTIDGEQERDNYCYVLRTEMDSSYSGDILEDFGKHVIIEHIGNQKVDTWKQMIFTHSGGAGDPSGGGNPYRPMPMTMGSGGLWQGKRSTSPQDIDHVVLSGKWSEDLKTDLDLFLKSKDYYTHKGIPWQRTYLFFGYPGCGKTSMIRALANHCNRHIYYLNLSTVTSDSHLEQLLDNVRHDEAIVVLEDIDTMHKAVKSRKLEKILEQKRKEEEKRRNEEDDESYYSSSSNDEDEDSDSSDGDAKNKNKKKKKKKSGGGKNKKTVINIKMPSGSSSSGMRRRYGQGGPQPFFDQQRGYGYDVGDFENVENQSAGLTLGCLLKVLDGNTVNHDGRIIIMTSNHPEYLDAALIREGRVDLKVPYAKCDRDQCFRLTKMFFEEDPTFDIHAAARRIFAEFPERKMTPGAIASVYMRYRQDPQNAVDKMLKSAANNIKGGEDNSDDVNHREHWQKLLEDIDPTGELQERAQIAQDISLEEDDSGNENDDASGRISDQVPLGPDGRMADIEVMQNMRERLGGRVPPQFAPKRGVPPVGQFNSNF